MGLNFIMLPCYRTSPALYGRLRRTNTTAIVPLTTPVNAGGNLEVGSFLRVVVRRTAIPIMMSTNVNTPDRTTRTVRVNTDTYLIGATVTITNSPVRVTGTFGRTMMYNHHTCRTNLKTVDSYTRTDSPLATFLGRWLWVVVLWALYRAVEGLAPERGEHVYERGFSRESELR